MEPWFNEQVAGVVGGIAGAAVGVFFGGVGGPLAGTLAPRGKCKGLVLGYFIAWGVVGVALLVTGIVALAMSQPYHVYFPFLLLGFVTAVLSAGLTPVLNKRYREAEERRMDAEHLRAT
ncbi:MAG: hypothetical protein Tsb0013_14060 [Phycisphaerales bacterium]